MSKPTTYVAIVLDKSGSMGRTRLQTIQGFNEQVQQYKLNAKDQDILCSVVTFNGDVYEHLWNVPADELVEATEDDYVPNGGTAMRDALGYTIQKLLDTTDHTDPNVAYLVICISDGDSINDKHYKNPQQLKELIDACESTKKWTFSFMGCSLNHMYELARQTGVSASNMASWDNSNAKLASSGMRGMTARSTTYFEARSKGITASNTYMNDTAGFVADFTGAQNDAAVLPDPNLNGLDWLNKQDFKMEYPAIIGQVDKPKADWTSIPATNKAYLTPKKHTCGIDGDPGAVAPLDGVCVPCQHKEKS